MRIGRYSGPARRPRPRSRRARVATSVVAVVAALGVASPALAGAVTDPWHEQGRRSEGRTADQPRTAAESHSAVTNSAATRTDPVPAADGATARQAAQPMPLQELTSAGGVGRLYTLDLAEARRAEGELGMERTEREIAYLPRGEFEGSKPMYRLKPRPDATAWLFTADADERQKLLDEGWVDEGVAGYLATEPGRGREPLLRFSNGEEWRLALESRRSELVDAGYQVDGQLGYAWKQHIRAGAFYFGTFNDVGGEAIMAGTEKHYGRKGDWWGGVRDFRNGTHFATDNWPNADFSRLKPAIGYYDDSEPETVEKHITQATSAGLSFFSFYWYWDAQNKQEAVTRKGLNAFLDADNREQIDFSVAVCAHPWGELGIPADQFDEVSKVLVDKYLARQNALRTNDGRKMLTICDPRALGDGSPEHVAQFTEAIRDRAQSKLGEPVFILINQGGMSPSDVDAAGGNGSYCRVDGPAVEAESYQLYLDRQRDYYAAAPGAYGRCVMSDFDERPRYPIGIADPETTRWMPDQSLEGYRQALRTVTTDIAESKRPDVVDNVVFLYAWNEWHEGGILEPTAADGCAYLDATREELGLTSGTGCVARP